MWRLDPGPPRSKRHGAVDKSRKRCLAKQQEKKQRRGGEAFQDGCLLAREVTAELRARVEARAGTQTQSLAGSGNHTC